MLVDRIYNTLPVSFRGMVARARMSNLRPRMSTHFRQFISDGDVVFDVGANIGDYTQVFSDLGASVIAIEPQPFCQTILEKRFRNRRDVTVVAGGAGKVNGILPFFISSGNHATSTFSRQYMESGRYRHRKWDTAVRVPVYTLDRLLKKYGTPSYCKIDVEGYEPQVVAGLSRALPYLSFEFTRESLGDAGTCISHLESLAATLFNVSLFYRFRFVLPQWVSGRELMQVLYRKRTPYLCGDIYARTSHI